MRNFTVFFFLFLVARSGNSQVSLGDIYMPPGPWSVGFRHHVATDGTRTYKRTFDWSNQSIARPVPISLWYPSTRKRGNAERMTVLSYMSILKEEEEWEYLPDEHILNWFYYPNTPQNRGHLKAQAKAFLNAPPAAGKFAVAIYAPSYQASSVENFALCEYLASHGYIVVSSPSRGSDSRPLEGGSEKDLETQARDVEFLINHISKIPGANQDQIAVIGFSFGGLSNVLAQMRNDKIKAVVSLDGSIKYQYNTLKNSPFSDIRKVDVPFIHMAQKQIPDSVLKQDNIDPQLNTRFEFYDGLIYSDAYSLQFHDLTHYCFSALGVLFQERDKRQDKTDREIAVSYKLATAYTLKFLDAYVRNDTQALQFLKRDPSDNGIRKEIISKRQKTAQLTPLGFQDFHDLAKKRSYNGLPGLLDSLRKKHPTLEIPEGNMNILGLQLVFNRATSENGLKMLLFAVDIYPQSANLFDSLGEAYLFVGDKRKGQESFSRSLNLDANNQNAIKRLKELVK